MLDTQDIIIPIDPQCGNDVRPNLQAVPAANRAESQALVLTLLYGCMSVNPCMLILS